MDIALTYHSVFLLVNESFRTFSNVQHFIVSNLILSFNFRNNSMLKIVLEAIIISGIKNALSDNGTSRNTVPLTQSLNYMGADHDIYEDWTWLITGIYYMHALLFKMYIRNNNFRNKRQTNCRKTEFSLKISNQPMNISDSTKL